MKTLSIAALVLVGLSGCDKVSEMTGGGSKAEKLLIGTWDCKLSQATGAQQVSKVKAEFEKGDDMTLTFTFEGDGPQGHAKLDVNVIGAWKYDKDDEEYSAKVSSARIDNISLNGKPMKREEYPGGASTLEQMEQSFKTQLAGNGSFAFKDVDKDELTMTDSGGANIKCEK
jgi:hypothetical protein